MWSVIGRLVLLSFGYFMARKRNYMTLYTWSNQPPLFWVVMTITCTFIADIVDLMEITRMPYNHEWQNGLYNTHKNLFSS